jgi:hypothetical protein
MSCDPNYMFSIDQHNMTVIEADGVNTQKITVDKIQVFAGGLVPDARESSSLTADGV